MPRMRWCICWPIVCLLVLSFWIFPVSADCWYDNKNYEEGVEVTTVEPCLNCTCSRGSLLCYLRICPKLPNPPPPGCILLHKYRTCCPELICTDLYGNGNVLEARSEPDEFSVSLDKVTANACISNGSIYGPGSAMGSSSLCEYCYCLGGKQTCVKPKCLLPVEGCYPLYESTNCCPVHYNCTSSIAVTSTTTTLKPRDDVTDKGGCIVDGIHHKEGGKVLGVGHSACDNCYCIRGILRCEPLSCAPPLHGCIPIIRTGECCAASYNCSGTIEIQPEPNIGQYPVVSKEYAKFRKEIQRLSTVSANEQSRGTTETFPLYVIAESQKTRTSGTSGTTRHFSGISFKPSTTVPFENDQRPEIYADEKIDSNNHNTFSLTSENPTTMTHKGLNTLKSDLLIFSEESLSSIVDSLLDNRLNRGVDMKNETDDDDSTTTEFYTTPDPISTTLDFTEATEETTTETGVTTTDSPYPITVKTVKNSTDCSNGEDASEIVENSTPLVYANEVNQLAEVKDFDGGTTTTDDDLTTTIGNVAETDLESKVEVGSDSLRTASKIVPLGIEEIILNVTKSKEDDYEYDYNEPTLPPSLPNLRIIPFVAADALDSKKDKHSAIYIPEGQVTETAFGYASLFSPPVETEGGFIPKEPPILENFHENTISTTSPRSNEISCSYDGQEILHGQEVPSVSICDTCTCFYGNTICQKLPCPVPTIDCSKSTAQDVTLCCPHYICDEEAPTVVLDGLHNSSQEIVTVAEGIVTPDPFRDVIRTEPAPDLQSLIVDMLPFLSKNSTTTVATFTTDLPTTTTTTTTINSVTKESADDGFSFDKVLQLLFSGKNDVNPTTTTTTAQPTTIPATTENYRKNSADPDHDQDAWKDLNAKRSNHPNSVDSSSSPGMGLLKLAGCNIYGRMYRVGRIISELSNPCLECKCTEIGVQCRALEC